MLAENANASSRDAAVRRRPQPLSWSQRRQWFLSQHAMQVQNDRTIVLEYDGSVDHERLAAALNTLIARHGALRASYSLLRNEPVRTLHGVDEFIFVLPVQKHTEAEITEEIRLFERVALDLSIPPALKARLFVLERRSVLVIKVSCIEVDQWSSVLLLQELRQLYESPQAHLPVSESAYPEAALDWERSLEYWQQRLFASRPGTAVPADHSRPLSYSPELEVACVHLEPGEAALLAELPGSLHCTGFVLHLLALGIVLRHWTCQDDILVGTMVTGRHAGNERVVGCFTNLIPLRLQFGAPGEKIVDLLARTAQQLQEDHGHAGCPFELIVQKVAAEASGIGHPLFNVAIIQPEDLEPPLAADAASGCSTPGRELRPLRSYLDLTFIIGKAGSQAQLRCEYDSTLFDRETITLLLQAWRAVLPQLARPAAVLGELELPAGLIEQAQRVCASELPILIAGDFTLTPLLETFRFWSSVTRIRTRVAAPIYAELYRQLVGSGSQLAVNTAGINCIFVRYEQWLTASDAAITPEEAAANVQQFAAALTLLAGRNTSNHVVVLCHAAAATARRAGFEGFRQECERVLIEVSQRVSNVHLLTPQDIQSRYPVESIHEEHGNAADMPYTQEYYDALATVVFRKVFNLCSRPAKVIVLDCDYTLWDGACSEMAVHELRIGAEAARLQRYVKSCKEQGMLLCLCSQNEEQDVWKVFEQHPDMVLRREDILLAKIDWNGKPAKIRALAEELSLGLDSFIFMDDDPLQCAQVRALCPQVATIRIPATDVQRVLDHVWLLDRGRPTDEDVTRTVRYRETLARNALHASAASYAGFIEQLHLQLEFAPLAQLEHIDRVAELSCRTNQFNLTGYRRNSRGIDSALQSGDLQGLTLSLRDRFGDYGMVGAILYGATPERLHIQEFWLSCRAMSRGVEHQMLHHMARLAESAGCACLRIHYRVTGRNAAALRFLREVTGRDPQSTADGYCEISTQQAGAARFNAQEDADPSGAPAGHRGEPPRNLESAPAWIHEHIAHNLSMVRQIQTELRAARRPWNYRAPLRARVAPQTPEELQLARIWSDLLRLDSPGPGVYDRFNELGGNSLLAMRMLNRVRREFGVELSVREFVQGPSIRELAALVHSRSLASRLSRGMQELVQSGTELERGDL